MTRARTFSDRTFVRYLVFQIPEWALVGLLLFAIHHYTDAPVWLLLTAGVGFALKDILLYPWLRHAYEKVGSDPGEHLVGRRGVAIEEVAPEGWVRVHAELWRAESSHPIPAGTAIRVRDLRGHVLVVEADA